MIKLAVLDIAGTTVQEHGAVYRALADAVSAPAASIPPWMGADKREAIKGLLTELGRPATPAVVSNLYMEFRRLLNDSYSVKPPEPLPGVSGALALLRSHGVKVALSTGFDRAVTDTIIQAVGWQDAVDAVVCTDDVPQGRPAPYMIYRAMEATGVVSVSQVLVAGDTTRDLESGTNAGAAMVIGVLTGGQSASVLGTVRHTHILRSVADIPGLLGF